VSDPCGVFIHVLKYLYTGNQSFVTRENAFAIHSLAVYLRLSNLQEIAETALKFTDANDIALVMTQCKVLLIPRVFVEQLARSFYKLDPNVLLRLSRSVLVKIMTNNNLRIASDHQLVLFLTRLATEYEISVERMSALSAVVEWSFLSQEEWNDVNLALFSDSDAQMAKLMRLQEECNQRHGQSIITIALISGEQSLLRRMERYVPPIVQFFQSSSDFFHHARDYGAMECQVLSQGRDIIVSMNEGYGLYFSLLEMKVRTDCRGLVMNVEFIPCQQGESTLIQCQPIDGQGVLVFRAVIRLTFVSWRVYITFQVAQHKPFLLQSASADGFTCKV
jgi:hypothetical protein